MSVATHSRIEKLMLCWFVGLGTQNTARAGAMQMEQSVYPMHATSACVRGRCNMFVVFDNLVANQNCIMLEANNNNNITNATKS